jgi:hypothetical protein
LGGELISTKVISRHKLRNIIITVVTSSHYRHTPVGGIYDEYFLSKISVTVFELYGFFHKLNHYAI